MARCVKCGADAPDPVWAAYADPAFHYKPPAPLSLHQQCYDESADRYLPIHDAVKAWTAREIERSS
jgi:hypothetical protein